MKFYTITAVPFAQPANWLVEHDNAGVLRKIGRYLDDSKDRGRLPAPENNLVRYALEESESARGAAPQPYNRQGGGDVLADTPFLEAIEALQVTEFRAVPVTCAFRKKRWDTFWRIRFEHVVRKELISGDEIVFREKDSRTTVYYSESAKQAIDALDWWLIEWTEHELPVCEAVPMASVDDVEADILRRLADLFRDKVPRASVGSNYGAGYFVDRLLETYSDITEATLCAIVEADSDGPFSTKEGSWVAVREDGALGAELGG